MNGQWLWLSWYSGRFQYLMSAVRIQLSAYFILNICLLSTVLKRRKYKTMMNAKSCFQIVFDMKCVVEASESRVNSIVKVK